MVSPAGWPSLNADARRKIASEVAIYARKYYKLKDESPARVQEFFDRYAAGISVVEFTPLEQQALIEIGSSTKPHSLFPRNGHSPSPSNGHAKEDVKEAAKAAEVPSVENKQAMKPGSSGALPVELDRSHPIDSTDLYKSLAPQGPAVSTVPVQDSARLDTGARGVLQPATAKDTPGQDGPGEPAKMRAESSQEILDASIQKALSEMSLSDLLKLKDSRIDQLREIQDHSKSFEAPRKKLQEPPSPYTYGRPLTSPPDSLPVGNPAQADETTVPNATRAEGRRWQSPPVSSPLLAQAPGSISTKALAVMIAFLAGAVPTLLLGFLEAEKMIVPPIRFLTPLVYFAMALGCVGAALVTTMVG